MVWIASISQSWQPFIVVLAAKPRTLALASPGPTRSSRSPSGRRTSSESDSPTDTVIEGVGWFSRCHHGRRRTQAAAARARKLWAGRSCALRHRRDPEAEEEGARVQGTPARGKRWDVKDWGALARLLASCWPRCCYNAHRSIATWRALCYCCCCCSCIVLQ